MYKQIVVCVLSSTLLLVASDEKTRKQRKATAPLAIPQIKNLNQKDRFIKLQHPPQLEPSNNLLTVCAYSRYTNGIGSEENSPRDGLSY